MTKQKAQNIDNMNIEKRIINLLDKEKPRPDRVECIEILENCLQAFETELEDTLNGTKD